ncbi:hypothetical protein C0995_015546 [Termitomyces sp. Mi166|nr:hypothetical protein C0995_015546 [Termitomyces sp. Mi166\
MSWIKAVSHVCSHWRKVALAAPNLWSNIPIHNPSWAIEMVRRSNTVPLIINYQDLAQWSYNSRPYSTLAEILRSHMSRIKSLTFYPQATSLHCLLSTGTDEWIVDQLIPLLCQPALIMEHLTLELPQASDNTLYLTLPYIPDNLVLMAPRLQYLRLKSFALTWSSDRIDLRNLRFLEISGLTEKMMPSTAQLLAILRQMSRLEILKISNRSTVYESPSVPQNTAPINLAYLKRIDLSDGLAKSTSLLTHIVFSKNVNKITLHSQDFQGPPDLSAQTLGAKIDDATEGSIVKLEFGSVIRCWKSKDTTQIPSKDASPVIEIGSFSTEASRIGARESFLRSLRLHHLISLVVMGATLGLARDTWLMFGNLPHLEDLHVNSYIHLTDESDLLKVLQRGLANAPDTPPLRPSFVALRRMTISQWSLNYVLHDAELGFVQVMQLLIYIFKLRNQAELPLEFLRLDDCRGVHGEEVDELREIIEDVEWDGNRGNRDVVEELDSEWN